MRLHTVFTATGVLIGVLVLVIAMVGLALPQDHVAARTVRVRQTPEQVFAIISDVENMPTWRPDVTRVEMLPPDADGRTIFREHTGDAVTYRVEVSQPPRRRVVSIADKNLPYGGTWTYIVAPVSSTSSLSSTSSTSSTPLTQITITERGEVYNPFFRFVSRFVLSHHATIDAYLVALGKKLGESVTPENATAQ
jgi:uncharacterized protein YndB with AHSA1/START domain